MLMKKKTIILFALVLMLVGCDSDNQNLDNTIGVNTETSNTLPDGESQTEEIDENSTSTEETTVKPIIVETKPSNWYIRLVAEDPVRALKSSSSQLGELEENDATQEHALKALNPFDGTYLDIVFVNPDGVAAGDYKSNFHVYKEDTQDSWQFTVKTNDTTAEIQLTWQGLYVLTPYTDDQSRKRYKEYRSVTNPLIKHMKLVDIVSGKEIAAMVDGKVEVYTFNMDGQNERIFEWVVQNEELVLSTKTSLYSTLKAKLIPNNTAALNKLSDIKKSDIFDLTKPPK